MVGYRFIGKEELVALHKGIVYGRCHTKNRNSFNQPGYYVYFFTGNIYVTEDDEPRKGLPFYSNKYLVIADIPESEIVDIGYGYYADCGAEEFIVKSYSMDNVIEIIDRKSLETKMTYPDYYLLPR